MAITRLWFFTLKPNHSANDPVFLSLWAQILELYASYTPAPVALSSQVQQTLSLAPKRAHHFLLQSAEDERVLVLISSYPSLALCMQADAAYKRRHGEAVLGMVEHRAMRQLDLEDAEVVPVLLGGGKGREEGVTVTISSENPLKSEIEESLSGLESGRRTPVPPPNREISGADAFEPPLPPREGKDVFEEQRKEGKRYIWIRRGMPTNHEGAIEVYRLKELVSR